MEQATTYTINQETNEQTTQEQPQPELNTQTQQKVNDTVTQTASKLITYAVKGLFTVGKLAGHTACAVTTGAIQGYKEASKELKNDKAPF